MGWKKMYCWTKKAEEDYRKKYPNKPLRRKAGGEVLWEGRPLMAGTILDGYISRGWIAQGDKVVKPSGNGRGGIKELSLVEQRLRWMKLQKNLSYPGVTLGELAKKMGYKSTTPVVDFVFRYGRSLAEKYGKLPYLKNMRRKFWIEVTESH